MIMKKLSHIAARIVERLSQLDSWAGEHCPKTYLTVVFAIMAALIIMLGHALRDDNPSPTAYDGEGCSAVVSGHCV